MVEFAVLLPFIHIRNLMCRYLNISYLGRGNGGCLLHSVVICSVSLIRNERIPIVCQGYYEQYINLMFAGHQHRLSNIGGCKIPFRKKNLFDPNPQQSQ